MHRAQALAYLTALCHIYLSTAALAPWELDLQLGEVHFNTSTSDSNARSHFNLGSKALHLFWYELAIEEFEQRAASDPLFAMAYWGIALSNKQALWLVKDCAAANKALRAITKEMTTRSTPREVDYIAATRVLFLEPCSAQNRQSRELQYQEQMQAVAAQYPDDVDAKLFAALATFTRASSPDCVASEPMQARCEEMVTGVRRSLNLTLQVAPHHPGVYHYILHEYDSPRCKYSGIPFDGITPFSLGGIAQLAATIYPKLVGSACHSLHMPSHIYLRIGDWNMSHSSNLASVYAADRYARSRNKATVTTDAVG